ncbi:MAG: glutathione S-transferase [Burkholderiaceae bacterium]
MLTLSGFTLSNYYNKVKMVLIEKGMPFVEERCKMGEVSEEHLMCSPLGKVPYIRTEHGALCESAVIVEYLESLQPEPRLLPTDIWEQAKVRELVTFVELHLELVVRELYPEAFFGGQVSDANKARVHKLLTRNIAAFQRLAKFGPYLAGPDFTIADCAAYVSLPLVAMTTKVIYGEDALQGAGIDWKTYIKLIELRPSAQKVTADRKVDQAASVAARAAAAS